MKALIYTAPHTLEYGDWAQAEPKDDEVLVKVAAVGICGSDMHAYHGHDTRRPPPLILGHEAAGHIASGPRIGQRVTINPLVIDPDCAFAVEGRGHLSPTRQILSMPPRPGAFAQTVCVPRRNLVEIPDHLSFEQAALAEPMAVCWHAVALGTRLLASPLASGRIVVLGGGAIGLGCALVATLFGAKDLWLGEPNPLRRQTAQAQLQAHVYDPGSSRQPEANSADLVIDAVGADATRAAASQLVRPGGVIVHLGLLPGTSGLDIRKITLQEVIFTGAYCYTHADFKNAVAALAAGHLGKLGWFEERALADGAQAFADIDAGVVAAAKIVLRTPG